jgi:hypothetical protein
MEIGLGANHYVDPFARGRKFPKPTSWPTLKKAGPNVKKEGRHG